MKFDMLVHYLGRAGLEAAPGSLQNHLLLFGEDRGLLVSLDGRLALVRFVVGHDECLQTR